MQISGWDPWSLVVDGLHCRRLATRLSPRLANHIKRCADRSQRFDEVESLLTADSTSVLHHLYKCNCTKSDMEEVIASPTYTHKASGYSLHVCFLQEKSGLCSLDMRNALTPRSLAHNHPVLLRALNLLLSSSVRYLFTHAIDVLCMMDISHRQEDSVQFPGTLISHSVDCPIEQLGYLLESASSHWLCFLSLAENRDQAALYAETGSPASTAQTPWSPDLLLLCEKALGASFLLRCVHEISDTGEIAMEEHPLIMRMRETLTLQVKRLASSAYANEALIRKGVARDFVMTNVLGTRRQELSVEALYQ